MVGKEFRDALRLEKTVYGTLITSSSPKMLDLTISLGLDYVFFCNEHIFYNPENLGWMCRAYKAAGIKSNNLTDNIHIIEIDQKKSGNDLYQLDPEDPLVPDKGVIKVPVWGGTGGNDWIWSWDGMRYAFADAEMIVTSNGKARVIYHLKHTGYYDDLP